MEKFKIEKETEIIHYEAEIYGGGTQTFSRESSSYTVFKGGRRVKTFGTRKEASRWINKKVFNDDNVIKLLTKYMLEIERNKIRAHLLDIEKYIHTLNRRM